MRVVVGRIGKAHGIRGEVTVEVRTDEPEERFAPGATLLTSTGSSLTVETARPHGGGLLVGFEGVMDRSQAEALRGTILEVDRLPGEAPADEEEYYDSDLIGCRVIDATGTDLGVVDEVIHLPGQDLLSIVPDQGSSWLLPLVHEFVPGIDINTRRITVTPPPGLIEAESPDGSESPDASGSRG